MEDVNKEKVQRVFLACRINEIRTKLGLSMTEFGALLDTSKNSVSQWEAGKVKPNAYRVRKIAELGNIPVEFLYLSDFDIVDLKLEIVSDFTKLMEPPSYFNDYKFYIVYKADANLSFLSIEGNQTLGAKCYIYNDGFCTIILDDDEKNIPYQFRYYIDNDFKSKDESLLISKLNKQLPKELDKEIFSIRICDKKIAINELTLIPYSDTHNYGDNPILKDIQEKLLLLKKSKGGNQYSLITCGEIYEWLKHEIKTFEQFKSAIEKSRE